jgi:hypothetical protein
MECPFSRGAGVWELVCTLKARTDGSFFRMYDTTSSGMSQEKVVYSVISALTPRPPLESCQLSAVSRQLKKADFFRLKAIRGEGRG